jgi:hypothetical protein
MLYLCLIHFFLGVYMTTARKDIIVKDKNERYHINCRCVQKAWLLGTDPDTGHDYNHRKDWIPDKLKYYQKIFCIDLGAYAVMDNHFHIIIENRIDLANKLTDEEVVFRWLLLHPTREAKKDKRVEPTSDEINQKLITIDLDKTRQRLCDISWYMKEFNWSIAYRANREMDRKGKFFEARFNCQYLADDAAVLTCMIYVDLNVIRARVAKSVENSIYTSAHDRSLADLAMKNLETFSAIQPATLTYPQEQEIKIQNDLIKNHHWLAPLQSENSDGQNEATTAEFSWPAQPEGQAHGCVMQKPFLNITLEKYLELLDYTGREYHKDKPGIIPGTIAPILMSMELNHNLWMATIKNYGSWFYRVVGPLLKLKDKLIAVKQRWFKGVKQNENLFKPLLN